MYCFICPSEEHTGVITHPHASYRQHFKPFKTCNVNVTRLFVIFKCSKTITDLTLLIKPKPVLSTFSTDNTTYISSI